MLFQVLRVLRYGVPWRDTSEKGRYSWKTSYARFRKWIENKAFEKLWRQTVTRYIKKQVDTNSGWFHELFIDATLIKNVHGNDYVGRNPTDRGRLGTKISVVCDKNMVIWWL